MEMLYHSVSDLVRLANEHQIPLWKVVLLADVQERQVTVEESFETMRQMYQAMRQADQEYDGSIVSASGMAAATEKNCTHTMPPVAAWRANTWGL